MLNWPVDYNFFQAILQIKQPMADGLGGTRTLPIIMIGGQHNNQNR